MFNNVQLYIHNRTTARSRYHGSNRASIPSFSFINAVVRIRNKRVYLKTAKSNDNS